MASTHTWSFFRAGGFDQVKIESGADLLALKDLDQKLWVALSCPTRGIEFDAATLDMIDSDGDAHVRANEVLSAIAWAGNLLKNSDVLVEGTDRLALADINDQHEEGVNLLRSARHILKSLGKADATEIAMADMANIEKFVASLQFNGDGVVTVPQLADAELQNTLGDIMRCCGSVPDLSGEMGANQTLVAQFFNEATAYSAWVAKGEADPVILLLGAQTATAAAAFHAIKEKVSDYFTRCQLAAYDARAAEPLSRSAADYEQLAEQSLSVANSDIAAFPLATVAANKPLSLSKEINPAWQAKVDALRAQVIVPMLSKKDDLSAAEWNDLCTKFAAFEAWQAEKPQTQVEQLGVVRLRELLSGKHQAALMDSINQDLAVAVEVSAIRSVERLLRYKRDLFTLVNNFVSFRNFYTGKDKAIFQVGTLYLDGRSCDLTIKVDDIGKHAGYATMSGICLVYCDCVRKGGTEKMSIAAAFTAGDSDYLMAGRNGVFYDRQGRDWDATIVRIVDNPISIRQAFWSPYKKLAKMISEQLQKLAASKASAADDALAKSATDSAKLDTAAPAKPAFDVGKFAGIFAAIGLAIGAIGGILASIVGGLLGLAFWQIPLALIGLLLMISGPSMIMAWFKLKRRNLAPILDANGWAVNARARINIPFGTSLTGLASLPQGANRSLVDPFAEKRVVWPYYVLIAVGIGSLVGLWYVGFF